MRSWSVGVLLFLVGTSADASSSGPFVKDTVDLARLNVAMVELIPEDSLKGKEPERLVAAGLAVLVGPFGAHRLYFGTKAKVPIIYGAGGDQPASAGFRRDNPDFFLAGFGQRGFGERQYRLGKKLHSKSPYTNAITAAMETPSMA